MVLEGVSGFCEAASGEALALCVCVCADAVVGAAMSPSVDNASPTGKTALVASTTAAARVLIVARRDFVIESLFIFDCLGWAKQNDIMRVVAQAFSPGPEPPFAFLQNGHLTAGVIFVKAKDCRKRASDCRRWHHQRRSYSRDGVQYLPTSDFYKSAVPYIAITRWAIRMFA